MPNGWRSTEHETVALRYPLLIAFLSGGASLFGPLPRFVLLVVMVFLVFYNRRLALIMLLGISLITPVIVFKELLYARGEEIVGTVISAGDRYLVVGDVRVLTSKGWKRLHGKVRVFGKNDAHPGEIAHVVVKDWRLEGSYPKTSITAKRIAHVYFPRRSLHVLKRWSYLLREKMATILDDYLGDVGYVAKGVVLGVKDERSRSFTEIGVSHFFAVSGFHVYILAGLLLIPFKRLMVPRNWRLVLSVIPLWVYLWIIGFPASAMRAVIMITLYAFFKIIDYPVAPLNLLGAVGLLNLTIDPEQILSVSFLLSYSATFGILTVGLSLSKKVERVKRGGLKALLQGFAITFAAQVAVLPINAILFGDLHPYAFFTTILLAWLVPFVMIGGIFILLLHALGIQWLATLIAGGTRILGLTIHGTVTVFEKMPLSTIRVQSHVTLYLLAIASLSVLSLLWHDEQRPYTTTL